MSAVNMLPPKCKVIFRLIKVDGFKYAETAELLEISIKTVEAQMAIAMKRLKSFLEFENAFPEIHSILTSKK
jgi:RNA polymerase sigma factor (sigma-70 family)